MKKVLAVLFSVIFAFSCMSVMTSATVVVVDGADKSCTCDLCGATFTTAEELKDHYAVLNPNATDHIVECEYCTRTFTARQALAEHEAICKNTADRKIPCYYEDNGCEETFATKDEYKAHLDVCNFRSLSAMLSAGEYVAAIKYIVAVVKDFINSDTFQTIISVVSKLGSAIGAAVGELTA